VQSTLKELERFQCQSGGFAYWPGECSSVSPYLTAYLLHVFKVAADLKYTVDRPMMARAYSYLETALAQKPPTNESWWPAYTAWQAFAVKVLVEGGRNQDSNLTRLYGYRDRMPVFALAYLTDALVAKGEGGGVRAAELRRRLSNAILPEAATAHVEELNDPYLMWFWNSNVRSTAIVLRTLVSGELPEGTSPRNLVTWLMQVRKNGRWGNTQENAIAMESLVAWPTTVVSSRCPRISPPWLSSGTRRSRARRSRAARPMRRRPTWRCRGSSPPVPRAPNSR
jgi:uncharacterized protein YfaS (alpha-2-macroglobulin family)